MGQTTDNDERRERGTGRIYQPEYGPPDQRRKSAVYWVQYYQHGRLMRESSGSTLKWKAEKLLKQRQAEVVTDTLIEPTARRIKVEELADAMLLDYKNNARKSYEITKQRWDKRLLPFFGHMKAVNVSTDLINKYVAQCKEQKLENGTINRDLAALKRAFYLGYRSTPRKVAQVPNFPRLKENAPRKGFVEDAQYKLLCDNCNGELWLRAMLAVGYNFGFRAGELLDMRVRQVNLLNETITLDPGTTKNDEAREVMFNDMLEIAYLLGECVRGKKGNDHVFSRSDGNRIRDFRGAWWALCIKAGLGARVCASCGEETERTKRCSKCDGKKVTFKGLLFHDLRRSAIRNMVRRGVPERVAMTISGHKTRSVFDRYNIVNDADKRDAARRIAQGAGRYLPLNFEQSSSKGMSQDEPEQSPTRTQPTV